MVAADHVLSYLSIRAASYDPVNDKVVQPILLVPIAWGTEHSVERAICSVRLCSKEHTEQPAYTYCLSSI